MAIGHRQDLTAAAEFSRYRAGRMAALSVAIGCALGAGPALAKGGDDDDDHGRFCSATASALFKGCGNEVKDDFFLAKAKCVNVSDQDERKECLVEAKAAREEDKQLCRQQRAGRLDACRSLGEGRYDPDLNPALFDDPRNPTKPNPYFPLEVGNKWKYLGGTESNILEVLDETKLIAGVGCIVVRDQVFEDGDLVEDTDDWFCHAKDGNTWYFGEEVKDFESFDGDDPRIPELVSIDGSFKAGRDHDKPGIIFLASPAQGDVYLEEFSPGNAEDMTEILSTTYTFGNDPELDQFVPKRLADRFCSGDCVVTKNFSLLEPGIFARKYYASGIGFFLEVNPDTGEILQLTDCNFDPRCENLPQP